MIYVEKLPYFKNILYKFDLNRAVHSNIISIVKPTRCISVSNLFYFGNDTLHVSDGLSVHHQEFKTVHTTTKQILLSACWQADSSICLV